jgi:hypothetical protein
VSWPCGWLSRARRPAGCRLSNTRIMESMSPRVLCGLAAVAVVFSSAGGWRVGHASEPIIDREEGYLKSWHPRIHPLLEPCQAIAKRRGEFGSALFRFSTRLPGGLQVVFSKALGKDVQRCVREHLRDFSRELHGSMWIAEVDDGADIGEIGPLFSDGAAAASAWVRANSQSRADRRAGRADLRRLLPPDATLDARGCLVVTPTPALVEASERWLKQQGAPLAHFMWTEWTKGRLTDLNVGPRDLHVLPSQPAQVVVHESSPKLAISRPGKHSLCLVPIDVELRARLETQVATTGSCWAGGLIATLLTPRFEFPIGHRYVTVRTGDDGRACALDANGSVTCCGLTTLKLPGSYVDMDVSSDVRPVTSPRGKEIHFAYTSTVCAVSREGDASCFGLDDGIPVARLTGRFKSISARANGACGITTEGIIVCSTGVGGAVPTGRFKAVNAEASCAIRDDGELVCWSAGSAETIGKGPWVQILPKVEEHSSCALHQDGTPRCWSTARPAASLHDVGMTARLKSIVARFGRFCGIASDCRLHCWEGKPPNDDLSHACVRDASFGRPFCAVTDTSQIRCWEDGGLW